jgi:hypothetical protein
MDYLEINKEAWDKRTQVHVGSQFYDVDAFKAGELHALDVPGPDHVGRGRGAHRGRRH